MTIVKPSSKYQIVLPREVRERLGIQVGQALYVQVIGDEVRLSTKSALDRYAGTMRGVWGDDPGQWLRRDRAQWDKRSDWSA